MKWSMVCGQNSNAVIILKLGMICFKIDQFTQERE